MTHSKTSWLEPSYQQTRTFVQKTIDQAVREGKVHTLVFYVHLEVPLSQRREGLPRFGGLLRPPNMMPVIPLLLRWTDRDPPKEETIARIESAKEHIEALTALVTWEYQNTGGIVFTPYLSNREKLKLLTEVPYNFLDETFDVSCPVCANIRPGPLYAHMECLQFCNHLKISQQFCKESEGM